MYENLPEKSNTAGSYYSDEKIIIGDGAGNLSPLNTPEFSSKAVVFNGVGENSHETFYIEKKDIDLNFCKTARKPYDLLVCACLIAAADILNYTISSDGNLNDWQPAISFYKSNVKNLEKRSFVVNKGRSDEFIINL